MSPEETTATATTTATLTVRCKLLARYAETLGRDEVLLELPAGATVADAVAVLRERLPRGSLLPEHPLVAVNLVHALPGQRLVEGDELALLPPLAGG